MTTINHAIATSRNERIDLRVTTELKSILVRAASLAGMSVSSFLVSAASDRAREILAEHEKITLTPQDWQVFLAALDRDDPPSPRLREAAQNYLERRQGNGS
ncbi:MAG: DUF1778 domain-containing protein [Magnetococcales bacterium]|nr:DUF1778 domain-containing protein [Magnetococcales bacterium]